MKKSISLLLLAALLLCPFFSSPWASGADQAVSSSSYVRDEAQILSKKEISALESLAQSITEKSDCGVYIVTVLDYRDYHSGDIYHCAVQIYQDSAMGLGDGADGELLLLSMKERDYALIYHGYADSAFSDYGRDLVEDAFLDDFRSDNWYGGLSDYLAVSSYLLEQARAGTPVEGQSTSSTSRASLSHPVRRNGPSIALAFSLIALLPCLIAGAVCLSLKSRMESVHRAASAAQYIIPGSVRLRISEDTFAYSTQERIRIEQRREQDTDKGGERTSERHTSGDYSGRSGKF